jgi:hypothetical protein
MKQSSQISNDRDPHFTTLKTTKSRRTDQDSPPLVTSVSAIGIPGTSCFSVKLEGINQWKKVEVILKRWLHS